VSGNCKRRVITKIFHVRICLLFLRGANLCYKRFAGLEHFRKSHFSLLFKLSHVLWINSFFFKKILLIKYFISISIIEPIISTQCLISQLRPLFQLTSRQDYPPSNYHDLEMGQNLVWILWGMSIHKSKLFSRSP